MSDRERALGRSATPHRLAKAAAISLDVAEALSIYSGALRAERAALRAYLHEQTKGLDDRPGTPLNRAYRAHRRAAQTLDAERRLLDAAILAGDE